MDLIKNRISATDPMHNEASVPDGEAALRRMLSDPAAFTDSLPRTSYLQDRRQRRARLAGVLTLAAAAVTLGTLVAANLGSLAPAPAPANTGAGVIAPTVSASSVAATSAPATSAPATPPTPATASAPAVPVAPARFVSNAAGASFVLPSGWSAMESTEGPAGYPRTEISVRDEAGKQVAGFYHGTPAGVGGACGPGPYKMYELDRAPALQENAWAVAAGARFSYRVLDMRVDGGAFDFQLGLVDGRSGDVQDSCLMYSFVAGAPQGTLSFADRSYQDRAGGKDPVFHSLAEAEAYMSSPEYQKLKAMILSLRMDN